MDQLLDDPAANMDLGLSRSSALNGRYFDPRTASSTDLDHADDMHSRQVEVASTRVGSRGRGASEGGNSSITGGVALSETSKLNKRYLKPKESPPKPPTRNSEPPKSLDVQRPSIPPPPIPSSLPSSPNSDPWQELGLSTSALNGRYFVKEGSRKLSKSSGDLGHSKMSLDEAGGNSNHNGHGSPRNPPRKQSSHREIHIVPTEDDYSRHSPSRQSSHNSNDGIDFPEFDMGDLRGLETPMDMDNDNSRYGRSSGIGGSTAESSRYVKYTAKAAPPRIYHQSTKAHIDRNREAEYSGARSSALSDTSEAPSLASHVKNVRIPSHTSDLDQYLDDLFNPVLDGDLDELSDARSLATAIKGHSGKSLLERRRVSSNADLKLKIPTPIGQHFKPQAVFLPPPPLPQETNLTSLSPETKFMADIFNDLFEDEFPDLTDPNRLGSKLKGGGDQKSKEGEVINKTTIRFGPGSTASDLDQYLDDIFRPVLLDEDIYGLSNPQAMATALKGGGQIAIETQQNPASMTPGSMSGLTMPLGINPNSGYPMSPPMINVNLPPGMGGFNSMGGMGAMGGFGALGAMNAMNAMNAMSGMGPPSINTNMSMFSLGGSPPPTIPQSPQTNQMNQVPYLPLYNVAGMTVPMVGPSQLIQQQLMQQQMMQVFCYTDNSIGY